MTRRTLGFLVAALAALVGVGPRHAHAQATYPPERYQALAREILAELIEIDTTHRDERILTRSFFEGQEFLYRADQGALSHDQLTTK